YFLFFFFFFFQAEDGIRDRNVTGVQTCALPISSLSAHSSYAGILSEPFLRSLAASGPGGRRAAVPVFGGLVSRIGHAVVTAHIRSEERRVGKECRAWGGS